MEDKPTEQQIPSAEAPNTQEELAGRISDAARSLLDAHGGEFVVQADGSQLRGLRGFVLGNPTEVMVSEQKPRDNESSVFTYGVTRLENPNNMQLVRWTEGKSAAEKGVRSNLWKDEDQMHGSIELDEDKVSSISFNIARLSSELERNKIQAADQPRVGKIRRTLGRLSFGGKN